MSTEFQDLAKLAFSESLDVTGTIKFRIRGLERKGSLTDLTEEEKMEWGQIVTNAVATLEFAAEKFTPPLVNGEKVSYPEDGVMKVLRVGKIFRDDVSIRFVLQDPNE